jgi:hypothetical protein
MPTLLGPGSDRRPVNVAFVVDKVALEQGFLAVRRFSPVSIIPPTLHIRISFLYPWHHITLATDSAVK